MTRFWQGCLISVWIGLLGVNQSVAQTRAPANSNRAEVLGAKAILEEMLSKRFARDLGALVRQDQFHMSTQLDLISIPKPVQEDKKTEQQEPISDLFLGSLDPEALIKKFSEPTQSPQLGSYLENFRIKTVAVAVGLKKELGDEVKTTVTNWLNERVRSEFGDKGKGVVNFISEAPVPTPTPLVEEPEKPKTFLDQLKDFQELAGQLSLGLAILLGAILFALLGKKGSLDSQLTIQNQFAASEKESQARKAAEEATRQLREKKESLAEETRILTGKIKALVPSLTPHLESLVRMWAQMGESGWLRIATFAEAAGQAIGRLPIPADAIGNVSKVFMKMTEQTGEERKDILTKIYWDSLSIMNLGPDALVQPFGYLGSAKTDLVREVLINENPRLKTIVTSFMAPEQRKSYVQGLSESAKIELLMNAAELKVIPLNELRLMDSGIASKLKSDQAGDVVVMDSSLKKLIESLSPVEAAVLPAQVTGAGMLAFKRSYPSLAFLNEWPEDRLGVFVSRATNDEVVTLLRVRPDYSDRVLSLCPPMTAKVAADELARPDKLNEYEKGVWLESLQRKMDEMIELREISLEEIFPITAAAAGGGYDQAS